MSPKQPIPVSSQFGEMQVAELHERSEFPAKLVDRVDRYRWTPSTKLSALVPIGFEITLDAARGGIDGIRRFFPPNGHGPLLHQAWLVGLAILTRLMNMNEERQQSYRMMYLLFQRVRSMLEHLRREFRWSRDLFIRQTGRLDAHDRDVLPSPLRAGDAPAGKRWSITQLTDRGREAAEAAGVHKLNRAQLVHWGLFVAACEHPLLLEPAEIPGLVRAALFDGGPPGKVDAETRGIVEERILTALLPHLTDDTWKFENWFSGPKNGLINQIAKQRRSRGGPLDKNVVRKVLLDLGWQAYRYVGDCLHAQLRTFQNAIPDPLTPPEQRLFEQIYLRQPHFADLPLLLLAERLGFLRNAIMELWTPTARDDAVAVLHRLLQFYAEMAASRREADRRTQQMRSRGGDSVQTFSWDEGRDAESVRR